MQPKPAIIAAAALAWRAEPEVRIISLHRRVRCEPDFQKFCDGVAGWRRSRRAVFERQCKSPGSTFSFEVRGVKPKLLPSWIGVR